jgi:hypothetical protein
MAYDAASGKIVLFGGNTDTVTFGDTWVYEWGGGGGNAPAVVSVNPANGATNVSVSTTIEITFSLAMDWAATESAMASSPSIAGAFAWGADDTKVTWTPSDPLSQNTNYKVTIGTGAKSAAGVNLPSAHSFKFKTGTPPPATDPMAGLLWPLMFLIAVALVAAVMLRKKKRRTMGAPPPTGRLPPPSAAAPAATAGAPGGWERELASKAAKALAAKRAAMKQSAGRSSPTGNHRH